MGLGGDLDVVLKKEVGGGGEWVLNSRSGEVKRMWHP